MVDIMIFERMFVEGIILSTLQKLSNKTRGSNNKHLCAREKN